VFVCLCECVSVSVCVCVLLLFHILRVHVSVIGCFESRNDGC